MYTSCWRERLCCWLHRHVLFTPLPAAALCLRERNDYTGGYCRGVSLSPGTCRVYRILWRPRGVKMWRTFRTLAGVKSERHWLVCFLVRLAAGGLGRKRCSPGKCDAKGFCFVGSYGANRCPWGSQEGRWCCLGRNFASLTVFHQDWDISAQSFFFFLIANPLSPAMNRPPLTSGHV